jgi:hypothetical protein
MMTASSVNGVPIRLTGERWQHIVDGHPEMSSERDHVLRTIEAPDLVQAGDLGELLAVRHWPITAFGSKFVVVAYREIDRADGFVLTAYLTRRPSRSRMVVWKR